MSIFFKAFPNLSQREQYICFQVSVEDNREKTTVECLGEIEKLWVCSPFDFIRHAYPW